MADKLWVEISLAGHGLSGIEALEVRNALEEQIEIAEVGEIVGGGCSTDGGSCDFELQSDDLDAAEEYLRGLLAHAELLEVTTFRRE